MLDRLWRPGSWAKIVFVLVAFAPAFTARAAETAAPTAPVVPGYHRLKAAEKTAGDAAGGELLLAELNCTACHATSGGKDAGAKDAGAKDAAAGWPRVAPKGAPDLSAVGSRVTPKWLRAYLTNPHAVKPGATMPDIFHASEAQARDGAVDFLVHFLMSQGGPMAPPAVEANPLM